MAKNSRKHEEVPGLFDEEGRGRKRKITLKKKPDGSSEAVVEIEQGGETEVEAGEADGAEPDGIGSSAIDGMYRTYYLDYASYVILERAVPAIIDGLKPVQRRILHSMKRMDDGRFHKVANIIGHTMQFHPHGDAAIGDALVNMGQKELLIETQGNWGDYRTGDGAAAARYIEARLSKFALEVAFNADTTEWQQSYDSRNREPVHLPMKFPLTLAGGVDGIAVGLATKILPHNFCELITESIKVLKGRKPNILPDFLTGGMADCSNYNGGLRGGKVRVRARIEQPDRKTLKISDVPYGVTTGSLIESIIKANDSGKIKIRKVEDNTAGEVEILVHLAPNMSPDVMTDALYAFTDCEVSLSPNCCIIIDGKPQFVSVNKVLELSTYQTRDLLKLELEIKLADLNERWHFSSLEKIFIENRIYRRIEECETWEAVIRAIDEGLEPFKELLFRDVNRDDIIRLTEIKIKRISKYDSFKADEVIKAIEAEVAETKHHLAHLTDFAIAYYQSLLERYGKGRERRTELKTFETIAARQVAVANQKLYVNRQDGFIGYGLKKDELLGECSDIDDVIVFRADGRFLVTRISEKAFVGKDIIHAAVWKKNDERMVYNVLYRDGLAGKTYAKRFAVTSITRDREYDVTQGVKGSKILYFTANPNSESETVAITLNSASRARIKNFEYDFGEIAIKGRSSKGNIVTRYKVRKVQQKEQGASTLGGLNIYLDEAVGRLNTEGRGVHLGSFEGEDKIIAVYKDGQYEQTAFELSRRFDPAEIRLIEKYDPEAVIAAIYYDGASKNYYVKRFRIETSTVDKKFAFISEARNSQLLYVTTEENPLVEITYSSGKNKERKTIALGLADFIDVKGWRAIGNKLNYDQVYSVRSIEPSESDEEE